MTKRKKLAVWKFASCDGCQLSILDLEDELLALAEAIEFAFFPEASSRYVEGPYDLSLVEGSITTAHDLDRLKEVRQESKYLVSIGACATAGGIQALRNFRDVKEFIQIVYAKPEYIDTLDQVTPLSEHVYVDYELRGCPIDKYQLVELVTSYLQGKKPHIPNESVCMECKRNGTPCILVTKGQACLGPVTHAGCDALCPRFQRGCFGCFGSKEEANTASLGRRLRDGGASEEELLRLFRHINSNDKTFLGESEQYDKE